MQRVLKLGLVSGPVSCVLCPPGSNQKSQRVTVQSRRWRFQADKDCHGLDSHGLVAVSSYFHDTLVAVDLNSIYLPRYTVTDLSSRQSSLTGGCCPGTGLHSPDAICFWTVHYRCVCGLHVDVDNRSGMRVQPYSHIQPYTSMKP